MDGTAIENTPDNGAWAERLRGTNINAATLLATDYLNHFNEVIMLIEMAADMPDLIGDVLAWEPKSYTRHFADSGFQDRNLAIEAYEYSPDNIRSQFEALVVCLDGHIARAQARLRQVDPQAPGENLVVEIGAMVARQHRLVDMISSVINGTKSGAEAAPEQAENPSDGQSTQDEIDALF